MLTSRVRPGRARVSTAGRRSMPPAGWAACGWFERLLARGGVPLDARDPTHKSTPLGWAAFGSVHRRAPGAQITRPSPSGSSPPAPTSQRSGTAPAGHCWRWRRAIRRCRTHCVVWARRRCDACTRSPICAQRCPSSGQAGDRVSQNAAVNSTDDGTWLASVHPAWLTSSPTFGLPSAACARCRCSRPLPSCRSRSASPPTPPCSHSSTRCSCVPFRSIARRSWCRWTPRGPSRTAAGWATGPSCRYAMYKDLRDHNDVFAGMFCHFPVTLQVSGAAGNDRVIGEMVSGTYFPVLGVTPATGRLLTAEDDATSAGCGGTWLWLLAVAVPWRSRRGRPFTDGERPSVRNRRRRAPELQRPGPRAAAGSLPADRDAAAGRALRG